MKKRLLGLMLSLVMSITSVVAFSAASISAATEIVPVYLNNAAITFPANDAQPQIISNRTYVPIRATCDALGLAIDWNSKTETLTFTRAGMVISHTMRSKIVYVNGEARNFDTPSINRNNRTLMPIRMLGESIGATVDWNNDTRSVHITTTATTPTTPVGQDSVKINSLTSNETAVAADATVTLKAQASSSTDKVKFVNSSNGQVISEVSEYSSNSDGTRTFETKVKCTNDTDEQAVLTVNAIPGTSAGVYTDTSEAIKNVSIIIASKNEKEEEDDDDSSTEKVVKTFDSKHFEKLTYTNKVDRNSYCKFTAVTDEDVKRVKVVAGDEEVIVKDYTTDDDNRVFEGRIKMTTSGSKEIEIDLYVDGAYEKINEAFDVKVSSGSSSSNDKFDDAEIVKVEIVNDTFYTGQSSPIYVTTGKDVDFIEVTADEEDDRVVGKTSFTTSKTSTTKLWTVPITVSETGSCEYTVNAYNDDDDTPTDTKSITLRGKKFSKSSPCVLSIEQRSNEVRVGEEATFTAKVSGCVTKLEIRREGGGSLLGSETSSSTSSSTKNISINFEIRDTDDYYTAYAYDSSGDSGTYTFKITGDTYAEVEITDIDYDDSRYEYGDAVDATVYTTNGCEKLWVEDARGNKVSKTYTKPTDEDGTEYIWEISFSTYVDDSDKSSRSFTIIAQGENKSDTNEKTVSVRFK